MGNEEGGPREDGSDTELFDRWLQHRERTADDVERPRTFGVPRLGTLPRESGDDDGSTADPGSLAARMARATPTESSAPAAPRPAPAPAPAWEPVLMPSVRKRAEEAERGRRRGRRRAEPEVTVDPVIESEVEVAPDVAVEPAPVVETPPVVEAAPVVAAAPVAETAPVAKTAPAVEPVETPAPPRRSRGPRTRRTPVVETAPAVDTAPAVEPVETPAPPRRRPRPTPAPVAAPAPRRAWEGAAPPVVDDPPPAIDFTPRTAARRVASIALLVSLAATAAAGAYAYADGTDASALVALVLALVTGVIWAVRAASPVARLSLHGGRLEVQSARGRHVFEVASVYTEIESLGDPSSRRWRLLFHRRGIAPFEIDRSMVDPDELLTALRYYRPEL